MKNIAVNLRVKEEKVALCLGFLTDIVMDLGVKGQEFKNFKPPVSNCDLLSNTRNISPTCAVKMRLREG